VGAGADGFTDDVGDPHAVTTAHAANSVTSRFRTIDTASSPD
jgi:hypothetical protein